MKYTANGIYTYISNKIENMDEEVYCTSRFEPIPEEFPTCYIEEITNIQPKTNVTLSHDDEQWQTTFEVQVYSNKQNGALAEASTIMDEVCKGFKELNFIRISRNRMPSADNTIVRLVSRFRRVIGGGDLMPNN